MPKHKLAIAPQVEFEILENMKSFILFFPDSAEALRHHLGPNHLPTLPILMDKIEARLQQIENLNFPGHPRPPHPLPETPSTRPL